MAIALSDVRFRGQSGRQSQRAPRIREQPRPKADMSTQDFSTQIDRQTPFHRPQIPAVIASLQAKVAQFEPWVKGNATALQSKQQSG